MRHPSRIFGPMAVVALLLPAASQAADDLATLRAEIAALKAEYAERVTALESRINQLETAAAAAAAAPVEPVPVEPPPAPVAPARNSSAFNPAISVILTGNYADTSQDPSTYAIAGF